MTQRTSALQIANIPLPKTDLRLADSLRAASTGIVLNVGSGPLGDPTHVNVDIAAISGVNVAGDLQRSSLPMRDASADLVVCRDILEHVENLGDAMDELHRVLKPNGFLLVQVPHFTSSGVSIDPTHRRGFSVQTFEFFLDGHARSYYGFRPYRELRSVEVRFDSARTMPWNRVLGCLVNRNSSMQRYYEASPIRAFPAMNIVAVLQK